MPPTIHTRSLRYFVATATGANAPGVAAAPTFEDALDQLWGQCVDWHARLVQLDRTGSLNVFWHRRHDTLAGITGDVHLHAKGEPALLYTLDAAKPTVGVQPHLPPANAEWGKGYLLFHARGNQVCVAASSHLRVSLFSEYVNSVLGDAHILQPGVGYQLRAPVDPTVKKALVGVRRVRVWSDVDPKTGLLTVSAAPQSALARFMTGLRSSLDAALQTPAAALSARGVRAEAMVRVQGRGTATGGTILDELASQLVSEDLPAGVEYEVHLGKNEVVRSGQRLLKATIEFGLDDEHCPVLSEVTLGCVDLLEYVAKHAT
jgi:hypothetical protein